LALSRILQAIISARPLSRRAWLGATLLGAVGLLAACSGTSSNFSNFNLPWQASPPEQPPSTLGAGKVKVGLILPLSAGGNAGMAAQSMKNAAEMALAEFNNPDIQLLVKDDGGNAAGAQGATQQALGEGAEIILGPLFAQSVAAVAQVARPSGRPVIAFSTDTSVASRGVYLLSFLPQTDVNRIVNYAVNNGKHSFVALVPDNAYGTVVEAAFKQAVANRNARIVALERYPLDQTQRGAAIKAVAEAARQADALFIPDGPDAADLVAALAAGKVNVRRLQLLGSGIWDDSNLAAATSLHGAWYPAPDPAGFQKFAARYQQRYGQQPVRTATLAYDAVALVAALVKTQGPQAAFSEQVLTNSSGFAGIDGIFRFRADGTNERGLAVMRLTPSGGRPIASAPRSFGSGT
jgi:ABC-type branched-subunit amino acid transport system substrate-binding protein